MYVFNFNYLFDIIVMYILYAFFFFKLYTDIRHMETKIRIRLNS